MGLTKESSYARDIYYNTHCPVATWLHGTAYRQSRAFTTSFGFDHAYCAIGARTTS